MVIQQLQFEMIKTFILAIVSLSIFASAEDQDEERRKPMGRIGRNRPAACRPNPPSPTDQVGGVSAQASTIIVTETIRETQVLTIPGETVLMTQTQVDTVPMTETIGETVMMTETLLQTETDIQTETQLQTETVYVTETLVNTFVETQTEQVTETVTKTETITQDLALTEEVTETMTSRVTVPAITVTRTIVKKSPCPERRRPAYGYGMDYNDDL